MEEQDGGRQNLVDNTYNENTWSRFTSKYTENLYIYFRGHVSQISTQ